MITRVKRLSIIDEVREDAEYFIRTVKQTTFRTRMFGTEHCRVFIVGNRLRAIQIVPPPLPSAQTTTATERS